MTEHLDRELIMRQNNRQNDGGMFQFAERTASTSCFQTKGPCDWSAKAAPLATGCEATLGRGNETVVQRQLLCCLLLINHV